MAPDTDEPTRKRFDATTLAFHGTLITLLLAVAIYLVFKLLAAPPAETPSSITGDDRRLQDAVSDIRNWIEQKRSELQPEQTPPPQARAPTPAIPPIAAMQGAGALVPREPNHVWRYAVTVEPPTWRDIALTYRVPSEGGRLVAYTDFTHAGGKMQFRLGAMQPGDPAHANVRFPGFFLHSAYLPYPLRPGQRVTWGWAWQGRAGGIKQFEGVVKGPERVTVPLGTFDAVRIDAVINYIEKSKVAATSRETLWVAQQAHGIVKIVREGVAPDEGFRQIVAELTEYK